MMKKVYFILKQPCLFTDIKSFIASSPAVRNLNALTYFKKKYGYFNENNYFLDYNVDNISKFITSDKVFQIIFRKFRLLSINIILQIFGGFSSYELKIYFQPSHIINILVKQNL